MENHLKDEKIIKLEQVVGGLADSFVECDKDKTLKQHLKAILSVSQYDKMNSFIRELDNTSLEPEAIVQSLESAANYQSNVFRTIPQMD
jgi:hypothetical protein